MIAEGSEKLYYSIGEVASMLEVSTSLIRFWETEFPHIAPRKNSKGDRRYAKKEIDDIRTIYQLVKEKGYTLQGAKDFLKNKKDKRHLELIATLQNLKALLLDIKSRLPDGGDK